MLPQCPCWHLRGANIKDSAGGRELITGLTQRRKIEFYANILNQALKESLGRIEECRRRWRRLRRLEQTQSPKRNFHEFIELRECEK